MSIQKVSAKALRDWVDTVIARHRVEGVQADGDRFVFKRLAHAKDLRLDYDVTILPPKTYFQPARECVLTFAKRDGFTSVVDDAEFVLMGVHPYDMAAIGQMDRIFERDHCDVHYGTRRARATIVVSDVETVSANAFAGFMGTAYLESGYDVLVTQIGADYLVDAGTKKGKDLLTSMKGGTPAMAADLAERKKVWERNEKALRKHHLKAKPADWPKLLAKSYEHPVWAEKAEQCFSCGSCNLPCPTCYCFDVKDEVNWDLGSGQRIREWDGCMLSDFATVAGNHNFRKKRADRYRHRYFRKGAYVPGLIGGAIACVGCGRCITACVSKIANPVEVFNRLLEGGK